MGFWRITQKDLILLARDRRALTMLLVMPLIFIAIIGMSTGQLMGWRNKNEALKIAVVDEDRGELAQKLAAGLQKRDGLAVTPLSDAAEAKRQVQEGEENAAVIIGPDFQSNVDDLGSEDILDFEHGKLAGNLNNLDVHIETAPSLTNSGAIVQMIVHAEVLKTIARPVLEKNIFIRNLLNRHDADKSQAANKQSAARDELAAQGTQSNEVYQKIVPAYTVLFTFFLVTIMARSFISERELGTLRRLRTTPIGTASLLLGKTIPFYFVSCVQGAMLFVCGKLLFSMSWGPDPWMLLPMIACTSLAATGLGLLIATLVRTDAQVTSFGTLVVLTMAGISGCFMPREWLPDAMQQISLITPHAWALIAYDDLLTVSAPNLERVWTSCAVLVGFALAYFLLGCWRFRMTE